MALDSARGPVFTRQAPAAPDLSATAPVSPACWSALPHGGLGGPYGLADSIVEDIVVSGTDLYVGGYAIN